MSLGRLETPATELQRRPTSPRASSDRVLAYSAMHSGYGGTLKRWFSRLFGPITYPVDAAEKIEELAREGTVVYVARAASLWLALYFNHALESFGLPLPRFVGGINLLVWQPVDRLWKLWRNRRSSLKSAWRKRFGGEEPTQAEALLAELTWRGNPSFIFLKPPRTLTHGAKVDRHDYFRALIAVQRSSDKPIFLVPHAVVDRAQSGSTHRTIADRIFGDRRRPGRLRQLVMLLSPSRLASVRVADTINLKQFIAEAPAEDDVMVARRLRHEVHRRISEEERVVAGPDPSAHQTIQRHVMRDPALRAAIEAEAQKTGKAIAQLERKAEEDLASIATRYNVRYVQVIDRILSWVFNRIYDGIVVDEPGLKTALEAARKGPLVFCPTHRSHVDYLVLSYVLWQHGITPPHIAAGANLSFFPLGYIFRRSGAFFLRRTFRDDHIYAAVFRAYVAELVRTGTSLEFFPEGTRSRTGKMLMPKFGMFSMIIDGWRKGVRDDVVFVPVSIDYERIIEASSYERELLGAEKQAEDVRGLVKATGVLRSRYGRVHLQFGEPMSLAEYAQDRQLPRSIEPTTDELWRVEIERLGYRILHSAAMVASITPTSIVSTALLAHRGRGMSETLLVRRSLDILEFLDVGGGRVSDSLQDPEGREAAILGATRTLVDEGMVIVDRPGRSDAEPIYRVHEDRRILIDFYKNGIMNHCAPAALVARAAQRQPGTRLRYDQLHEDTRFLSRLFKREFLYRADSGFTTYFDDSLASLAIRGYLDVNDDGTVVIHNAAALRLLAALLDSFVETYWVTAKTLRDLREFPLWDKELVSRSIERARRAFLEGEISRPEAANRTVIETALGWFGSAGVIATQSEGKRKTVRLTPEYEGEKLDDLWGRITGFL